MFNLGLTFKENCPDVRNTKVLDIYRNMAGICSEVDISDPRALRKDILQVYGKDPIVFQKVI